MFSSGKLCFERTYSLLIQIANFHSFFNTIALNVQIYIIQPTLCEQLENADNGANSTPRFLFCNLARHPGGKAYYIFLLPQGMCWIVSVLQDVLGDWRYKSHALQKSDNFHSQHSPGGFITWKFDFVFISSVSVNYSVCGIDHQGGGIILLVFLLGLKIKV